MGFLSAASLLGAVGPYAAGVVFLVLLVESALPIGFVLPGDTLLLTAGLTCAVGHVSLGWMLAAANAGAILGAHGGYLLGRAGSRFVRPRHVHVQRAIVRFEKLSARRGYGPALVASRFIPVARSVAGPLSGLLRVAPARFTVWQVIGGFTWATAVTLAGYGIGRADPGLERFVPLFLLLAALTFPITAGLGFLVVRVRARRLMAREPIPAAHGAGAEKEAAHR